MGAVRPHAGGGHAEGQLRVQGVEPFIQVLNQLVDIVPPPVADVVKGSAVLPEGVLVVEAAAGVEVVVQVDAVHIVVADQLLRPLDDQLPHLGQAGIQIVVSLALHHPLGVLHCRGLVVQIRQLTLAALGKAEGVDPGVELQPQGVSLLHPVGQGIKAVFRGQAGGPGQVLAPGEQLRGIEGVPRGTHLEDHRVHPHVHAVLQNLIRLGLEGVGVGGGGVGVVQVVHRGHPNGPEVIPGGAGGIGRLGLPLAAGSRPAACRKRQQQCRQSQQRRHSPFQLHGLFLRFQSDFLRPAGLRKEYTGNIISYPAQNGRHNFLKNDNLFPPFRFFQSRTRFSLIIC